MSSLTKGHRITKAAAQTAYRKSAVSADGKWFSPRRASAYTGFNRVTLLNWRENGCPWLDSRSKLIARKFADGFGRETDFYSKEQLDKILAAIANSPGDWVPLRQAATVYDWSQETLRAWTRRDGSGCLYLEGAKLTTRKLFLVWGGHSRPGWNTMLLKSQLEEIGRRRTDLLLDRGEMTSKQAMRRFGISRSTVHRFCRRETENGGRGVTIRKGHVRASDAGQSAWIIAPAGVARLQNELAQPKSDKPFRDRQGKVWLPKSLALRKYPRITAATLWNFADKPCPWLGGDILRTQRIDLGKRKCRWDWQRVWLESDLKRMQAPRPGRRARCTSEAESTRQPRRGTRSRLPETDAGQNGSKQHRKRPRVETHLKWKKWHQEEGLSIGQIVIRHEDETGQRLGRSTIQMAISRC